MTPFRAPGRLSPGPAAVMVTWRPVPSLLRAPRELTKRYGDKTAVD
jgi:hypothetical protein